jgi:hypothetical protein
LPNINIEALLGDVVENAHLGEAVHRAHVTKTINWQRLEL